VGKMPVGRLRRPDPFSMHGERPSEKGERSENENHEGRGRGSFTSHKFEKKEKRILQTSQREAACLKKKKSGKVEENCHHDRVPSLLIGYWKNPTGELD